jgi:hypothetical protein
MWSLHAGACGRDDPAMQILAGSNTMTRADRFAVARSALSGILLVVAGLLVGWLCIGTPLVQALVPSGRPTAAETATGVIAWGFAIVVPAAFMIMGVARIASIVDTAIALRPKNATSRLAKALGPEYVGATGLVIPGGRRLHELVLGPFGILVIALVPPKNITRHVGNRWEIRDDRGRWLPIEAPVDRATRDAERVRGWLASDDRDFIVRVYAAIITDDPTVERTPACAVVSPTDLAEWILALPVQRGLNDERRARLAEQIAEVAALQ